MESDTAGHIPVLSEQVCRLLEVKPGETVVDATVGLAGHAMLFFEALAREGTLVGLDADPANLAIGRRRLIRAAAVEDGSSQSPIRIELVHANFAELETVLSRLGIRSVDVIFADLGMSSTQLDDAERGFSFQRDGPLDMRMDPRIKVTAADLVNRLGERELGDLIYHNSQERASRRIARRICEVRRQKRITTTSALVEVIANALRVNPASRRSRIHPATKTFQALRMAVNEETRCLGALLDAAPRLLAPDGRIGIVAFHSVEDKAVKLNFRARSSDGIYRIVTKRPVTAEEAERQANPRSRSAKLRVATRLKEQAG